MYFIKKACYPRTILNLKSYGGKIYFETENKPIYNVMIFRALYFLNELFSDKKLHYFFN